MQYGKINHCYLLTGQFNTTLRTKYEYYSKGETVLLKCRSDANDTTWFGPSQAHRSGELPFLVIDEYGRMRIWDAMIYTYGKKVYRSLTQKISLQIVGNNFNLQIRNFSKKDEGLYGCLNKNRENDTALLVLQEKSK